MLIKFTSAITGCGFYVVASKIVSIEPWESVFPDELGLIPRNTNTLLRLEGALQLPVAEDFLDVLEELKGALK